MGQFLPDSSFQNFRFQNTQDEFPQSTIDSAPRSSSSIRGASVSSESGKRGGTGIFKRYPLTGDQTMCPVCQETLYSDEVKGMTCGHLTCLECYNALWEHAMERGRSSPSCPLRCEVGDSDVEIRQLTNPVRPSSVMPSQSITFSGDNNFNTTAMSNPNQPASSQYSSSTGSTNFSSTTMVAPSQPTSVMTSLSQMSISEDNNFYSTEVPNSILPPASGLSPHYSGISNGNSLSSIKRDRSNTPQAVRNRNRRRYFNIF